MRSLLTVLALAALTAACGASGSTPAPATSGTALNGLSTPPPVGVASAPAQQGGGATTVTVVLTGGGAPGTYTGTDDPNCSFGLVPGAWGVQFSIASASAGQLSSVQLMDPTNPASASGVTLLVTVGPLLGGVNYDMNPVSGGSATATVNDNGSTAVIHATGTTPDGAKVDATINCPTVTRANS